MAIISVKKLPGRSGSLDAKSVGEDQIEYQVKTDSKTGYHYRTIVFANDGVNAIPAYYAPHPEGGGVYVIKKRAVQDRKNPFYWIVTVEYGALEAEDGESPPDPEDPETRRPILVRSTWKYTKNVIKDRAGNLIVNKAGQPPAEGLDIEVVGLQYTYTKWSSTDGEALFESHLNHLNDGVWKGFAARTALCSDIHVDEERVNGTLYYKHTYQVMVRLDGSEWQPEILNWGFKERLPGDLWLIDIVDDKGRPIQQPWFLDANGRAVRPQDPLAADNFVKVDIHFTANFSTLW